MTGDGVKTTTTYSPYGETLGQSGNSGTMYGFTGEQEDDSTGFLYLRARYYSSAIQTFVSRDSWLGSMRRPATLNGFNYVYANPTNAVDPTGHEAEPPGFIENYISRQSVAWNITAGPNLWLNAALRLPVINQVYGRIAGRLTSPPEFMWGTVRQLYAATWVEAYQTLQADPCNYDSSLLPLEAAHVSMITLAAFSRGVGPQGGALAFFPGYIANPRASTPVEQRGADTAAHFFFHAFLAFEMRYAREYAPLTADQLTSGLLLSGVSNELVMEKIQAIRDEYRSRGYQDFDYLNQEDYFAYSFATTAGDLYEVISTYDSVESQSKGGFCYERGGLPYFLRNYHGCALHAFTDSLDSFQQLMSNPSNIYPSGVQDPGVFNRDLRANRAGAAFGIRAFNNPFTLP
jgi:RHS repeat-associated protein